LFELGLRQSSRISWWRLVAGDTEQICASFDAYSVRQAGFWGLRSLSSVKLLLAKDLSEMDAQQLQDVSQQGCFLPTFTPGKCLLFGFCSLFYKGGGGTSSSLPATQTITQFARG
jgi:hypothetical protein